MDLFSKLNNLAENILPLDGNVHYYDSMLSKQAADQHFFSLLNQIKWKNDEALIFGKKIRTKRKVAWYADQPYSYTYSNHTKTALPWINELLQIKQQVENKISDSFNSCLLNLYHSGNEGVGWHSDNEKDLKQTGAIASLSLGAERKFSFKHKKTKKTVSLVLGHGSLLVMRGTTQIHWLHQLPRSKLITEPRINLTFRTIVNHSTNKN